MVQMKDRKGRERREGEERESGSVMSRESNFRGCFHDGRESSVDWKENDAGLGLESGQVRRDDENMQSKSEKRKKEVRTGRRALKYERAHATTPQPHNSLPWRKEMMVIKEARGHEGGQDSFQVRRRVPNVPSQARRRTRTRSK